MRATVSWLGGVRFRAQPESGHEFKLDGGGDIAPSPMEYVINALGGCASIDVVMILEKGRHKVTACRCELHGERADSSPRVFTHIHAHFIVTGQKIPLPQAVRSVELSFGKYCSVTMMLNKGVQITHSVEVLETDQ